LTQLYGRVEHPHCVRLKEQELLNVIDALYEGMLDESAWNRALVQLTDAVSGSAVILFSANPSTGEVVRSDIARLDPVVMSGYENTWIYNDPRHAAGLECPIGEPQIDGMLMDTRDFRRSSIFNEFFRPSDVPFHLAVWLARSATRGVALSVLGAWHRGAFEEEERECMKVLIPHVRRVVEMKDRMARDRLHGGAILEMMDRLPYGVLLLGPGLEILEASASARAVLAGRTALHADDGRLGFLRSGDERAFTERLKEDPARANRQDAIVVSRGRLHPPLSLVVLPLQPRQEAWLRPAARWLVIVLDPESTVPPDEKALQRVLHISAAEAALARQLASGLTLAEAAAALSISIHTARYQLKSIFAKVGVRTQAQLVRHILNGPASLMNESARAPGRS
jgi:DNA-binding CsgD family transcriptional regulator